MSATDERVEKAVVDDDGIRMGSPVSAAGGFYYAGQRIDVVGRCLSWKA